MKKLTAITILILLSNILVYAQTPYIEIQWTAWQEVEPDRFEINIELNEADSKGKISLATMEQQLAKALSETDVDTVYVTSRSSAAQKKQTYQYKNYTVILKNYAQVAALFAAFETYNVANASLTKAWYSKNDELQSVLQNQAVAGARQSAAQMAQTLGQSIGKAMAITDRSYFQDGRAAAVSYNYKNIATADTQTLPIENSFKKIRLEKSVLVRFELK